MNLVICPSSNLARVPGSEVKPLENKRIITEEHVKDVMYLMIMGHMAAKSLFEDLGLRDGEVTTVGKYIVKGRDFCTLPISEVDEKIA